MGAQKRMGTEIWYYAPAAVFTVWTLAMNVMTWRLIPLWHIWNLLLWIAGALLHRGRAWGCLFGLAPAAMVLYGNRGEPGGAAFWVGLCWLAFYLGCGLYQWKKKT